MRRREARELVLAALYQREFTDAPPDELPVGADPGDQRAYVQQVLKGIADKKAEIDALIGARTVGWRFERLALVDRNILRLGVYELLYVPEVPGEVVIDEAVELSKKYGTENARLFVNGILDRIWKERGERAETGGEADRAPSAGGPQKEGSRAQGARDDADAGRDRAA